MGKHQLLPQINDSDTEVTECVKIFLILSFSTFIPFTVKAMPSVELDAADSPDVAGG